MGTNYYYSDKKPCPCCGRQFEKIHIGKSSGGWCFSLHVIPEIGINNLDDWKKKLDVPESSITNEYGFAISPTEMVQTITERSLNVPANHNDELWLARNHAVAGPNGLLRHMIDGRHCIGHGEGTWDYITGEFS